MEVSSQNDQTVNPLLSPLGTYLFQARSSGCALIGRGRGGGGGVILCSEDDGINSP